MLMKVLFLNVIEYIPTIHKDGSETPKVSILLKISCTCQVNYHIYLSGMGRAFNLPLFLNKDISGHSLYYKNYILMGLEHETFYMGRGSETGKEFLIWKITRQ